MAQVSPEAEVWKSRVNDSKREESTIAITIVIASPSGRVATLLSPNAVIVRTFFLVCDCLKALIRITCYRKAESQELCFNRNNQNYLTSLAEAFSYSRQDGYSGFLLHYRLMYALSSFDSCSLSVLSETVRSVP